jgi:hypothetical protein
VETVEKPRSLKKGNAAVNFVHSIKIEGETCQGLRRESCPVHDPWSGSFD